MKALILIVAISSLFAISAQAAKPKSLFKEKHNAVGEFFQIEFFGHAEFCEYDSIEIARNEKSVLKLKNRCGRKVTDTGPQIVSSAKYSQVVVLGPNHLRDTYFSFSEEQGNYNYVTTLVPALAPKAPISISEIGHFQDFDNDGLLDLVKSGGGGHPTGNDRFSYDPYLVLKQTKVKDKVSFVADEALSKKLSQEKKFEWHGLKATEKIQVNKSGKIVK